MPPRPPLVLQPPRPPKRKAAPLTGRKLIIITDASTLRWHGGTLLNGMAAIVRGPFAIEEGRTGKGCVGLSSTLAEMQAALLGIDYALSLGLGVTHLELWTDCATVAEMLQTTLKPCHHAIRSKILTAVNRVELQLIRVSRAAIAHAHEEASRQVPYSSICQACGMVFLQDPNPETYHGICGPCQGTEREFQHLRWCRHCLKLAPCPCKPGKPAQLPKHRMVWPGMK